MKRPFLVSIKGNITNGEVIDAYVYAKNKESRLAYRLIGPIKKSKNPKGLYPPDGYKVGG